MAHYAKVNENGIVTEVLVIEPEVVQSDDTSIRESLGPKEDWIQTSYNTRGGKHYAPNSNEEDDGVALRYNMAQVGGKYDKDNDAFYAPQPFASWVLDSGFIWQPPVAMPTGGRGVSYIWIESEEKWEVDTVNPPHESWTWDAEAEDWVAPKAKPVDGKKYRWNDEDGDWELSENQDKNRSGK